MRSFRCRHSRPVRLSRGLHARACGWCRLRGRFWGCSRPVARCLRRRSFRCRLLSLFACGFLPFWFRVCSAFGAPVGSVLAAPFFVSSVPSCWVRRRLGSRAWWVRRWPSRSCGRGSFASGFRGRWVVCPASSLAALRLSCFVWSVSPAVVSRFGGLVFSVWAFVSPAPFPSCPVVPGASPACAVAGALAPAFA